MHHLEEKMNAEEKVLKSEESLTLIGRTPESHKYVKESNLLQKAQTVQPCRKV